MRRLGYLLELANHSRQAKALEPFVKKAKTLLPLNPAAKPLVASLAEIRERNTRWKLVINDPVEVDHILGQQASRFEDSAHGSHHLSQVFLPDS